MRPQPPRLAAAGMVDLEDHEGLRYWPRDEIAMVRDEAHGRLEITDRRGEVGHRPGPLAALAGPPFVEAAPGVLVHPRWVEEREGRLLVPGGWEVDRAAPLGAPPEPPEDPVLDGVGVRLSEVRWLDAERYTSVWRTDRGPLPDRRIGSQASLIHPHLVKVAKDYMNLQRLRAIRLVRRMPALVLDTAEVFRLTYRTRHRVAATLGLTQLRYLEPCEGHAVGMRLEGLRDWPVLLWEAPPEDLRRWFGRDRRRLIANVIWQVLRLLARGTDPDHGRTHRDLWYRPVFLALVRAGLAEEAPEEVLATTEQTALRLLAERPAGELLADPAWLGRFGATDPAFMAYLLVLAALVGDHRLFVYRDLLFEDQRPDLRRVGDRLPHVVIVVEKDSLRGRAELLASRFGASLLVTGGQPSLIGSEHLAGDLLPVLGGRPVVLVFLGDWDPPGWVIPQAQARQLERYGVPVSAVKYLVRPERFTPEEIALFAHPLHPRGPSTRGLLRRWLAETGGIGGQALGLHADHFWPAERVLAAFLAEMAGLM